jgi:hypothetical protein
VIPFAAGSTSDSFLLPTSTHFSAFFVPRHPFTMDINTQATVNMEGSQENEGLPGSARDKYATVIKNTGDYHARVQDDVGKGNQSIFDTDNAKSQASVEDEDNETTPKAKPNHLGQPARPYTPVQPIIQRRRSSMFPGPLLAHEAPQPATFSFTSTPEPDQPLGVWSTSRPAGRGEPVRWIVPLVSANIADWDGDNRQLSQEDLEDIAMKRGRFFEDKTAQPRPDTVFQPGHNPTQFEYDGQGKAIPVPSAGTQGDGTHATNILPIKDLYDKWAAVSRPHIS